jgi:hypothetical protein
MLGLKDVSATETRAAYKTVPAISVILCEGVPVVYETTAPDFLCMGFDEAVHALEHGYAPTWGDVGGGVGGGGVPCVDGWSSDGMATQKRYASVWSRVGVYGAC